MKCGKCEFGGWFVSIVLAVALTQIQPAMAEDQSLLQRWRSIEETHLRQMEEVPSSVQVQFVTRDLVGDSKGVEFKSTTDVVYLQQGARFYSREAVHQAAGGRRITLPNGSVLRLDKAWEAVFEKAYDGNRATLRKSDSPNMIFQSRRRDWMPLMSRPWQVVDVDTPDSLEQLMREGTFVIVSLENDQIQNMRTIKVTFDYKDIAKPWLMIWYDTDRANMPILAKEYGQDGTLYRELSNVEIASFDANGNRYYVPIKSLEQTYENGKVVGFEKMTADPASIKIGEKIPDEKFVLKQQPTDEIYDSDGGFIDVWPTAPGKPNLYTGQFAPPFIARALDGTPIHFPADYKAKIVLVDFWATWCGACMDEVPDVASAYQKLHSKGLEILGISFDQPNSLDKLKTVMWKHNMTWPQIYEGTAWKTTLGQLYGIRAIPHLLLVDGDTGKIVVGEQSKLRGAELESTLEEALKDKFEVGHSVPQ